LLDWTQAAGFIDNEHGKDRIPDILKTDKLLLVAVLAQVRATLDEFADLNGTYEQLRNSDSEDTNQQVDLVDGFYSLLIPQDQKIAARRKNWLGVKNVLKMGKMVKTVATEPKRLWWVAFDDAVFMRLLEKLAGYNKYLNGLLRGHEARLLAQTCRNTELEMISMRSSFVQLNSLIAASMLLNERRTGNGADKEIEAGTDGILRLLAQYKNVSLANDACDSDPPPEYEKIAKGRCLARRLISYTDDGPSSTSPTNLRTKGTLVPDDGQPQDVWIEWKPYSTELDEGRWKTVPVAHNLRRVAELVALLQMAKPKEFCVPSCLGYFDDRGDEEHSGHPQRFGLVFEFAPQKDQDIVPKSLIQAIHDEEEPTLDDRINLAKTLATCLLYLHAVGWLHKGIRSDSVIFFKSGNAFNFGEAYLSGFEYARPDREGATLTGSGPDDNNIRLRQFYRHPSYQGANAQGTYRKTFDVYSLGIVLLEIAYWQPIQKIMGLEDVANVGDEAIAGIPRELCSPEKPYMKRLKPSVGEKYESAVRACITGRDAFGIAEAESEMDVLVGAKLQRAFTQLVVDPLGNILH